MLPGGSRISFMILNMLPGLDLYCTDPAQHFITEGYDLDDLDDLPQIMIYLICPTCDMVEIEIYVLL